LRPAREHATNNRQTYFIGSQTAERRPFFKHERWAKLMLDCVYHYRGNAYLLHEFVIMHDHFHLLITPQGTLEKAAQFVKGGFSYRAKKELEYPWDVWQRGFSDHRIRNASDYNEHVTYIHMNPLRKGYCARPQEYPYSSAFPGFDLDAVPQGLKPQSLGAARGAAEAAPFQGKAAPNEIATPEDET
jgi:putative transposase